MKLLGENKTATDLSGRRTPIARLLAAAVVLATISGCAEQSMVEANAPDTSAFSIIPASSALVTESNALAALQRRRGGLLEQKVVLQNQTLLRGDNVLYIALRPTTQINQSFRASAVFSRLGGIPYPFSTFSDIGLKTGQDSLGTYFWKSVTPETGVTCVLAIRRVSQSTRYLPSGYDALDVALRNCVNGTESTALRPIEAVALGFTSQTGGPNASQIHTISPLAAP